MPKKVLIVDDSRSVRMQVGYTLREAGFKVIEAKDGQEGLRLLQQHPDLAVIIADINMPELDGISMTEKIKAGYGPSTTATTGSWSSSARASMRAALA